MAKYFKTKLSTLEQKATKAHDGRVVNRFQPRKFLKDIGIDEANFQKVVNSLNIANSVSLIAMLVSTKDTNYDVDLSTLKLLVLLEMNDARKVFLSSVAEASNMGCLNYDSFASLFHSSLAASLVEQTTDALVKGSKSTLAMKSRHPLLPEYDYFSIYSLIFMVCDSCVNNSALSLKLLADTCDMCSKMKVSMALKDKAGQLPTDLQWRDYVSKLFSISKVEETQDYTNYRKALITFATPTKDWSLI